MCPGREEEPALQGSDADGMGLFALQVGGNNIFRDRCIPTLIYTCIYIYSIYSSAPIFAGEPCSQCWGSSEGSPAQGLPDHLLHGATGEHLGPTPLGMSWENRAGHRRSPADTWAQRHPARGLGLSNTCVGPRVLHAGHCSAKCSQPDQRQTPKCRSPGRGWDGCARAWRGQLTVVFLAILLHVDLQLPLGGFAV